MKCQKKSVFIRDKLTFIYPIIFEIDFFYIQPKELK